MQSCNELLASLYQRGITIRAEHGEMRIQSPKGQLLPEELEELRARKPEIIQQLELAEGAPDVPLKRREAGCPVPLTAAQMLMWNRYPDPQKRHGFRFCHDATRVFGTLDVLLLQSCIEAVVRRHESLRTRIVTMNGMAKQEIDSPKAYKLDVIELTDHSGMSAEAEISRRIEVLKTEPVDLSVGPLFEAKLLRLSRQHHVLILALDHLIADGVSTKILNGEIWSLYDQGVQGLALSIAPLPIQFGDYSVWQERMYPTWLRKHAVYWKTRLSGASRTRIPLDDRLTEAKDLVGAVLKIPFGENLSAELRKVARREQTLLALVVLTIYSAVMSRWCSQRDLLLPVVINGRYRPELDSMIGNLGYLLHLRIGIANEDSLLDLFKRISAEYYLAYDHQDFGWAPGFIPELRDPYSNLDLYFNWLSSYWSMKPHRRVASEINTQPFQFVPKLRAKFRPVFLETPAGVDVIVQYRPDLLALSTVQRFGSNLMLFAEEFVHRPHTRVASIPMKIK